MDSKRKIRKTLVTAAPDTSAQTLAILMRDRHVGAVVITEKNRPVGIVTDRDLVSRVVVRYHDPLTIRARDIMTSDLVIAREGTQLAKLTEQMRARGIRRVPIVDAKGRLVNILTLDDMLVVLGEEIANLGRAVVTGMGKEARVAARGRANRLRSERIASSRPK